MGALGAVLGRSWAVLGGLGRSWGDLVATFKAVGFRIDFLIDFWSVFDPNFMDIFTARAVAGSPLCGALDYKYISAPGPKAPSCVSGCVGSCSVLYLYSICMYLSVVYISSEDSLANM